MPSATNEKPIEINEHTKNFQTGISYDQLNEKDKILLEQLNDTNKIISSFTGGDPTYGTARHSRLNLSTKRMRRLALYAEPFDHKKPPRVILFFCFMNSGGHIEIAQVWTTKGTRRRF